MEGLIFGILLYLPLYPPVLSMTPFFFTLILAVIFSWSCESAAFMSCNLLLHLLVSVTSTFCYLPQGILSFFLLYFSISLIIHKENTKEVNV